LEARSNELERDIDHEKMDVGKFLLQFGLPRKFPRNGKSHANRPLGEILAHTKDRFPVPRSIIQFSLLRMTFRLVSRKGIPRRE